MSLTVAPTVGYDSFASLEDANTYFADRGWTAWAAASIPDRENALRVGTVYVNSKRLLSEAIYPAVNMRVAWATFEAAKLSMTGALYKAGTNQSIIEKTVGPLTIRYAPAVGGVFNLQPFIDDLLSGLTYNSTGGPIFFERV